VGQVVNLRPIVNRPAENRRASSGYGDTAFVGYGDCCLGRRRLYAAFSTTMPSRLPSASKAASI
jgi:hypothetical protein